MKWTFKSRVGSFAIVEERGRFIAVFEGEGLGSYHRPEAALDDLVGGHTYSLPGGIDSSTAGLPDDLADWTFVR